MRNPSQAEMTGTQSDALAAVADIPQQLVACLEELARLGDTLKDGQKLAFHPLLTEVRQHMLATARETRKLTSAQAEAIVNAGMLMTELQDAQAELLAAREAAEEASRAKSRFLANVSHELRTPMNGVMGILELLLSSPLQPKQREYCNLALRSANSLLRIVSDILDVSKIEAGKLELENISVDLYALCTRVADVARVEAEKKSIRLLYEFDSRLPPCILSDEVRLQHVLGNLVGNAVKFTETGYVALRVQSVDSSRDDRQTTVRFTVEDSGIGISQDALAKLFVPFQQADASTTRRFGGTGLGLAIAQQLLRMMGAELRVGSVPGTGTRCEFELAVQPTERVVPLAEASAIDDQMEAQLHVLLVEDHPVNRIIASQMLTGLGCTVTHAETGLQALKAVQAGGFALVLMDWQMPEMDGLEATRRIRAWEAEEPARGRVPIIGLTANAMAGDREQCLAAGMDDYLAKPFKKIELARAMQSCRQGSGAQPETKSASEAPAVELIPASTPVLDAADFDNLRELEMPDQLGLVQQVVAAFRTSAAGAASAMAQQLAGGDVAGLRSTAHMLKSSAAYLGLQRLSAACRLLESAASGGAAAESLGELFAVFEREYRAAIAALDAPIAAPLRAAA